MKHLPFIRPFELKITKVSEVDMSPLEAFIAGKTNEKPDIAFTCLDLILRHVPSLKLKNVGRSFFNVDNFENISDGVAISKGTFLSVRPARGQILLNMDTAAAALYQSGKFFLLLFCFFFPVNFFLFCFMVIFYQIYISVIYKIF